MHWGGPRLAEETTDACKFCDWHAVIDRFGRRESGGKCAYSLSEIGGGGKPSRRGIVVG